MASSWSTSTHDPADDALGGDVPIEAVCFDFGGIFITSPFAAAAEAAVELGIDEHDLLELVFGPYDVDGDHPWHRLERGELTFDAANAEIVALAEAAGHGALQPMDALAKLAIDRSVREFMVDLVRDLRAAGIKTGIITNNIAEFGRYWREIIPVAELFDDVVDSSEVGMRKPDPAIYRLACERLEVAPEAALFIDDHQGNVVGARAIGMGAIWSGLTAESTLAAAEQIRARIA
jgi:epoxide hydrolase-like predicted phosphatase